MTMMGINKIRETRTSTTRVNNFINLRSTNRSAQRTIAEKLLTRIFDIDTAGMLNLTACCCALTGICMTCQFKVVCAKKIASTSEQVQLQGKLNKCSEYLDQPSNGRK